ncbi:ABC transporter permease [Halalkalibacillus sediminis]|uniref:ABC transporter permease n=1 Tax=Halalkalibacillus sediminis TaxID=2018042 RepID=A0A2I0QYU9_9BACI|nr:ABC transporter permease [Halalkalibacillus sediminis]PKR79300.1 ABC transporter permease [Halalkalibacillus sediminis]
MSKFFKQVFNEQVKLYIKKSTWVMYILVAALIVGIATMNYIYNDPATVDENWESSLQEQNEQLERQNALREDEQGMGDFGIEYNENEIAKNNFRIENDVAPNEYGAWAFVLENAFLLSLVSLLTIIVAAGIVSNEFKWGTIKLLLIRPITRTNILLSKYVSVLLFAFFTLLFVWVFSLVVGMMFFGFEGFTASTVVDRPDGFEEVTLFGQIMSTYGYGLVNLVMMATFAFMISTIFRQSSLAIGLAIFLMLSGNTIVTFFADRNWAKFILFANTNLQQYETGNTMLQGMSLSFSITVLLVYYVIFIILSWVFFTKRDVAGQ